MKVTMFLGNRVNNKNYASAVSYIWTGNIYKYMMTTWCFEILWVLSNICIVVSIPSLVTLKAIPMKCRERLALLGCGLLSQSNPVVINLIFLNLNLSFGKKTALGGCTNCCLDCYKEKSLTVYPASCSSSPHLLSRLCVGPIVVSRV